MIAAAYTLPLAEALADHARGRCARSGKPPSGRDRLQHWTGTAIRGCEQPADPQLTDSLCGT